MTAPGPTGAEPKAAKPGLPEKPMPPGLTQAQQDLQKLIENASHQFGIKISSLSPTQSRKPTADQDTAADKPPNGSAGSPTAPEKSGLPGYLGFPWVYSDDEDDQNPSSGSDEE